LLELTRRFDWPDATLERLRVSEAEIDAAIAPLDKTACRAFEHAAQRIEAYHIRQKPSDARWVDQDGITLGWRWSPLDSVGLYVPGGTAALSSSVLMNALPAKIAGVRRLAMACPTPGGRLDGATLFAARLAGVDEIWRIGGAQAIGAFAFGTKTIGAVDKVVGPGNAYVAAAKRRVFGTVGIDMIAGPSEILVLCDGTTDPRWVAMDLFSQAEHDELAQSILLCPDEAFIARVHDAINELLPTMPRRDVIERSLVDRGALIKVRDMAEACAIANQIAPEHLEISALDPHQWAKEIRHAGAIFLGRYTSESLGDYCAGPNHVLPTSRTARFSSPLGVYDFFKRSSVIEVSAEGAQTLGEIAAELAYGEGLPAHARSAEYRMKQGN
jgi:histidinol dehydrogenase